ncbi:hypothetical protein WME99_21750 [Sorangium sp. So ce136]|uniref:hypothetical protein n=1 Tax=Sorangium sp. So ce136 TaxID=3133284 RepID=UPI003F11DD8E
MRSRTRAARRSRRSSAQGHDSDRQDKPERVHVRVRRLDAGDLGARQEDVDSGPSTS